MLRTCCAAGCAREAEGSPVCAGHWRRGPGCALQAYDLPHAVGTKGNLPACIAYAFCREELALLKAMTWTSSS